MKKIREIIDSIMSENNLKVNEFFRYLIESDSSGWGWVDMSHFVNLKGLKKLKCSAKDLAQACLSSKIVELNYNKTKIRRISNKPQPAIKLTEDDGNNSKVREVIEKYLDDQGLRADKNLLELIHSNKQGWVDISFFMKRKKVSDTRLTEQYVANALKDSTYLEVSECEKKIRRKDNRPLPQ